MNKILKSYCLEFVCQITPELDEEGLAVEYFPQSRYAKKHLQSLNKYGEGGFCKFKIKTPIDSSGVYAIYENDKLIYLGECKNLKSRFCLGYGNISPKNCYKGGQETNCRINKLILESKKNSNKISLYWLETEQRKSIEKELIKEFKPDWNH
jgi:hypothetical protein